MRCAASVAALLLCSALILAVQTTQPPVFRSRIDLVEVPVVVTDQQGRFVEDLTAADFDISERDVPQTITAFDRVTLPIWRAEQAAALPPVPADVSTNERLADGRIFVLVLDALHVSPTGVLTVRRHAREFIEDRMGPADLVAVLSPGAIEAASQDFTTDKARLLAAIDQFVGSKLRSATLELEDERQAAAVTGVIMHGGKDPGDGERADRAVSLSSVLESLAGHLARVERRRKALLLFSEGIDYNTADVLGGVQEHASDVLHAMDRAVGALMRANVSLYAIDPRALASADGSTDRQPWHEAPNAPRTGGALPRMDFSEPSIEGEYAASIAGLRHFAESTGGFANVTGNDSAAVFERIVRETSDYYLLAYTPAKRGKPGAFQPVSVRVRRPGLRVIARSGYVVPAGPTRAVTAEPPVAGPPMMSPFASRRPGGIEPLTLETAAAPVSAPKGLASGLAELLSSPLPLAGLSFRVQATPFDGKGKKALVQLVTEVSGSSLAFVERSGRFESRLEIASFTVDSRGKGANGRSTSIDLRLTPDEFQRARATGIRWISQLELAPGRYQLRVAARETATSAAGVVTADVDVPSFTDAVSLSGVVLTSLASAPMVTRGDARLASSLRTPPTAERSFVVGDRIVAAVEVYVPAGAVSANGVTAEVERIDGEVVLLRQETLPPGGGRSNMSVFAVPIDTAAMPPGRYILRIRLEGASPSGRTERRVLFDVVAGPRM
jgi:VWFA-related protein